MKGTEVGCADVRCGREPGYVVVRRTYGGNERRGGDTRGDGEVQESCYP